MNKTEKEVLIYEKIAPDEVYILYKDEKGVLYVGNKDGKVFVEKACWKEEKL